MPEIFLVTPVTSSPAYARAVENLAADVAAQTGFPVSTVLPEAFSRSPWKTAMESGSAKIVPLYLSTFPELPDVKLKIPVLPLASHVCQGHERIARILAENVRAALADAPLSPENAPEILLVDHGSSNPAHGTIRESLAERVREQLHGQARIQTAALREIPGVGGPFLEEFLSAGREGVADAPNPGGRCVVVLPLFLFPGRHAGPGGDLEAICTRVSGLPQFVGGWVRMAPLIGAHPDFTALVVDRVSN